MWKTRAGRWMPDRRPRVLVVGGGLAGVAAALAAVAEHAQVTLISRAPGATSLYAGAMDIAPPLEQLAARPFHPFNRLGMDGPRILGELDEACSGLTAALARAGLELRGGAKERG